ncbi:MAG: 6-carboxytetrahydropterin synthase [Planctomycetota bacterium]
MYEIQIDHEFCAAHALFVVGLREPKHGHNFKVTASFGARELDSDGLVVDFHEAQAALREICSEWDNRDLNETPPFDGVNPTAEAIAREIATRLEGDLGLREGVGVAWVSVTEAPGCRAVYRA